MAASLADVAELQAFAARTYEIAFGAGFPTPEDLRHHLETRLSLDNWRDYLTASCVLMARDDESLVGFVQFGPRPEAGQMELTRLYVEPELQGQGVGSALLRAALAAPEMAVAREIWLDVWRENPGARRLYERFGFVEAGRHPYVLVSGEESGFDWLMVRRQTGA